MNEKIYRTKKEQLSAIKALAKSKEPSERQEAQKLALLHWQEEAWIEAVGFHELFSGMVRSFMKGNIELDLEQVQKLVNEYPDLYRDLAPQRPKPKDLKEEWSKLENHMKSVVEAIDRPEINVDAATKKGLRYHYEALKLINERVPVLDGVDTWKRA